MRIPPSRFSWLNGKPRRNERILTVKCKATPPFYQAVAQGDVDLWVNGRFPLHNSYKSAYEQGAEEIGYVSDNAAPSGYLIDKKTADQYNIKYLEDMEKPEIRRLFDTNGDGRANMVACPPGWGCEKLIDFQINAYNLEEEIDLIKAAYAAGMADALGRYKNGEPIFFYTWTPNWTVGLLKPGEDVVWLQVKDVRLPPEQAGQTEASVVKDVEGCPDNPCVLGVVANTIRPVANSDFLKENPAIEALLKEVRLPLSDIFVQNAKMNEGANKESDLKKHAAEWIDANAEQVEKWLAAARAAAD